MDNKILAATAAAFASIDVSAENTRIDELIADTDRCEKAISDAEARCTHIARTKADYSGPDGRSVANALLGDAHVSEAALAGPNFDKLDDERLSLQAGIRELKRQIDDNGYEIRSIRLETSGKAAVAAEPIVEGLREQAEEAGRNLLEAWASIYAIAIATRGHNQTESLLRPIAEKLTEHRGLLDDCYRGILVPDEICDTLEGLQGKGIALITGVPRSAPLHR